jgi:mannose-6-phosphate isomerase-like protein (cupin superfamily)
VPTPSSSRRFPPVTARPLHVHRHETEIFYILDGKFEVLIGGQKVPAPPGAIAVGPRDIPHTFRNVGSTDGRLLLTVIPGNFANYFIEVDGVRDEDHAAIRALAAKYDVEILE